MYRIGKEELDELKKVIDARISFKVNGGLQECYNVEERLKGIFGVSHALFMTSGQAALTSALVAAGVGPGDQVIVPAYTYIATAMAVVAAGAIPVIAEVDGTLTLDPADFERKITAHTKAVMPVHIQGFPCNMDAICEIAKKHGILVIEDACQADGGGYKGKRLGAIGDAGALSFNYFKIVSAGEGGALLTNNRSIFEAALIYHDSSAIAFFGNQMDNFTTEQFCGTEYRANEVSAAIMNVQLGRLDGILSDLRRNKAYLAKKLEGCVEIAPSNDIEGDCGTTLPLRLDAAEKAATLGKALGYTVPIDTGKHIYTHWTPILEKRGAFHPLMDPFRMEANRDIIPDYRPDDCPRTLDYLKRTVYVGIDPDADETMLDAQAEKIKNALAAL